jgi:hydrogenase/urease accessory protein HupE
MAATTLALATPAVAHPSPFSTLNVRPTSTAIEVAITAHVFDLAHDLGLPRPDALLDDAVAAQWAGRIVALLGPRIRLTADGVPLAARWTGVDAIPERQSVRVQVHYPPAGSARITIEAALFPYDPAHQTFVNIYRDGALDRQAIIDAAHPRLDHATGAAAGSVLRRFGLAGVEHILGGFDHLLFLVALLLLGGSPRRLLLMVSAFTVGHSITLSVAALALVIPPARLVEPAIALSIVCVGADNLLARGGRDIRPWFALGFGLIHGFGFAGALREMGLPARALAWSLFSLNLGVEVGQLVVVVVVAAVLRVVTARNERAGRRLAFAGSLAVAAAGAFWFIQRVFFFSGGIS